MPTYLSSTTSRANSSLSAGSVIAAPPYLMTTVLPWNSRMYGSASSRVATSRGCCTHHVVYSALMVTYSWPRSEKNTSVSAPSPGRPISYSTSSRGHGRASASASCGERRPARAHLHALDRDVERERRGARQGHADGLGDPAPVRVAAVQRGLDQRRVGDRAGDRVDGAPPRRRGRRRGRPAGRPRRRARSVSASWRSSASSASPKRSSSSVSGSTATPGLAAALQDHGVVGRQLAVDADRARTSA